MDKLRTLRSWIGPLLVLMIFAAALWALHRELHHYHLPDIRRSLSEIPLTKIWLAIGLAAANYLVLVTYDLLALRSIGRALPLAKVALASFTGYVTSFNFGHLIGGTSVRYRLYSAWGLSAVEILRLALMLGLTLWLGLFALGGTVFLLDPFPIPAMIPFPIENIRPLGVVLLGTTVAYLAATYWWRRPIRIHDVEFTLPRFGISMLQVCVASVDIILAAGCLYALLPTGLGLEFFAFVGIYVLAVVAVVASHVPGGVGVLELTVLALASPRANEQVVAALLAYRAIYYLFPLVLAMALLGGHELLIRRAATQRVLAGIGHATVSVTPFVLALATFAAGVILLLSGALPAVQDRMGSLGRLLPLPLIEASHLLGSICGAALLLLARGLQRRLDSAWWLATCLLAFGIAFSLLKGFDYEEATLLAIVLGGLLASRRSFYRRGSLIHARFTPGWIAAIALVVSCSVWLGFFVHRHTEYSTDMWWSFALEGDAPRFLRASVGVASLLFLYAFWTLVRRDASNFTAPQSTDLDVVESIVRRSPDTAANLALLGDKSFLFNDDRSGFVMFAVRRRSWVALGDPVGPATDQDELVWCFRELVDRYDGWPVFYEVGEKNLGSYLEQGLTLLKLGEEARVRLDDFSLEGSGRKGLRHAHHNAQKHGCSFEIMPREAVTTFLPTLKAISDAWLAEKQGQEKGFSLGSFNEAYLCRFPCAVVRQRGETIAFANVWQSCNREELSMDLMRHRPAVAPNLMDFLITELMLWGRGQGYHWFNLGMAPLSGIETRSLAPLWNSVAGLIFRHGEHFYRFEGLREYKKKFDPVWSSRYIALPGGLTLPWILADVTALISNSHSRPKPHGKLHQKSPAQPV